MSAAATSSVNSSTFAGLADLKVGEAYYSGWKSLRATRSIEQMSGQFEVSLAERWSDSADPLPIRPGMACQLLLDKQPVISGWIDDVTPSHDANNHSISICGRDKTADLVDCSAIHKTGQWKRVTIAQIARDLLKPFGIDLVMQADAGKAFPSYDIQPGETVFECLDRAARLRALLLTSNAEGALVITRASDTLIPVVLEEGKNIKAAAGQFSWKERFSQYILRGQDSGNDDSYSEAVASEKLDVRLSLPAISYSLMCFKSCSNVEVTPGVSSNAHMLVTHGCNQAVGVSLVRLRPLELDM